MARRPVLPFFFFFLNEVLLEHRFICFHIVCGCSGATVTEPLQDTLLKSLKKKVHTVAQQDPWCLRSAAMQVPSPAWHKKKLWTCWVLNPLCQVGGKTCILAPQRGCLSCCATVRTPYLTFYRKSLLILVLHNHINDNI